MLFFIFLDAFAVKSFPEFYVSPIHPSTCAGNILLSPKQPVSGIIMCVPSSFKLLSEILNFSRKIYSHFPLD